jgi:hypothetical protein
MLLLVTLHSNVYEIHLNQSVANVITSASTLGDSASLYLCIDFVLFFFLEVGKNPMMTASKVHHSPFTYQIFAMQMKIAIQECSM